VLTLCRKKVQPDPANGNIEQDKAPGLWVPLFGLQLERKPDGSMAPPRPKEFLLNTDELFDAHRQPKGEFDEEAFTSWQNWVPFSADQDGSPDFIDDLLHPTSPSAAQKTAWLHFVDSLCAHTQHWLGLSVEQLHRAYGLNEPFCFRLVDRHCPNVQLSEFGRRIQVAVNAPDEYPLIHHAIANLNKGASVDCSLGKQPLGDFLGHMDMRQGHVRDKPIALDPSQRHAAAVVAAMPFDDSGEPELLPVNGPPGTGKTSFLRAALASVWVRAALEKRDCPPVIYGVAETNQATTNMVEAFRAVKSVQLDGPAYPWLPKLDSYGWFFPSEEAAKKHPKDMQLSFAGGNGLVPAGAAQDFAQAIGLGDRVEDDCLDRLKAEAIRRAKVALGISAQADLSLEDARDLVHEKISNLAQSLRDRQQRGPKKRFGQPVAEYEKALNEAEAVLDIDYRTLLFHWAARYWECCWLLRFKPDMNTPERIKHFMMLGVIIVGTSHKIVALCRPQPPHLLIMDEAGQTPAHVGASLLTVTRKAVFIGDVHQLEPIAALSPATHKRLLEEVEGGQLSQSVLAIGGSAMAMAKDMATRQSLFGTSREPGITLRYHYRCAEQIMGFCNDLRYGGQMIHARQTPRRHHLSDVPQISWQHIEGAPSKVGQSWKNQQEVQAITQWVYQHYDKLTRPPSGSGRNKLEEIVAIITPLAAQKNAIRNALKQALGEQIVKGVTIGTVHSLQGAQKPVVLFSLVQDADAKFPCMADRDGGHLMNVAVSRAEDVFVMFGRRPQGLGCARPTGRLAEYAGGHEVA
jgi:hypothetical protein